MQADLDPRQRRELLQSAAGVGDVSAALRAARELLDLQRPADLAFCATAFRKLTPALLAHGHNLLKTFLVRSVTVEPLLPALQVEAVLNGYVLEMQVGGYGSYAEELLDPQGAIGQFDPDLVCVLLDMEEIAGSLPMACAAGEQGAIEEEIRLAVDRTRDLLLGFRSGSRARLIVQGCFVPTSTSAGLIGDANSPASLTSALSRLNHHLASLCRDVSDCLFFDVDAVSARVGKDQWRDERMFLANRLPVAVGAFRPFAHALMRSASALFRPARKVICTDLDNTLWGGVLGEDGPGGIVTGPTFPGNCYLAYQRYLKEVAARGVLLAITSKNNQADVMEAFSSRAADLALTMDSFVAQKIGWNDKVSALRELAAELSVGLDSFVFVDDSPVECEAVRRELPEVAVVEVSASEPWQLVPSLQEQWYFDVRSVTAADRNRSQDYKAQSERAALSRNATSREEFLGSLDIVCTFLDATEAPLERSVQLLTKTNQFNLTTRRHSAAEVSAFASQDRAQALAVRVRDRFGDAGVVGLALAWQKDDQCWIDTLLLSCRVIGRGIETAILAQVAERARYAGARWLVGEYIETKKNVPCKNFYADHGFQQQPEVGADEAIVYKLDLSETMPQAPAWLTLQGRKSHELADSSVVPA